MNVDLLNGANLAFIGDAYMNLYIREYIMNKRITHPKELHNDCVKYLCATGHDKIVKAIIDEFNEEELNIFKRGRNFKYQSHRKNLDQCQYLNSSGLEAVIGYLYLKKEDVRLKLLLEKSILIIEAKDE